MQLSKSNQIFDFRFSISKIANLELKIKNNHLVEMSGIEPLTSYLQGRRSPI